MNKIPLFALILIICACSSSKEPVAKTDGSGVQSNDSTYTAPPSVDADNLLAPGTARVQIQMKNNEAKNDGVVWHVLVKNVMGYGSSTPIIDSGVEMAIDATTYVKNSKEKSTSYKQGVTLKCVLEHKSEPIGGYNKEAPQWQLIRILDN